MAPAVFHQMALRFLNFVETRGLGILGGLEDFACEIQELADDAPKNEAKCEIGPATVLCLQIIVDSFTTSRGWLDSGDE